jgi:hypothetical protein
MIELVQVVRVRAIGDYRLEVAFSNGAVGVRDFADMIAEGGEMVVPLHDPAFFARVFVQNGVPAWPNGYDIDAAALHQELQAVSLLKVLTTA